MENKSFLQSDEWLEFQKSLGRKVWQIEGINIIKHNLPIKKSYLYSPRCPASILSELFITKIKEIAKQENAIFFKIEPFDYGHSTELSRGPRGKPDLEKFSFRKSTNIQPTKTIILDITKSEQELLSQMHYKTRYNIQLAIKKGVKTYHPASPADGSSFNTQYFNEFWKLMTETAKRDKFRPHPKEYYRKMLQIPGVELFLAEYEKRILVANIVFFWDKIAIYLHGASDYENRNLMAPFLLQWEQIKEAKKRGCIEYDFWGIDEQKWPGVTRFKRGFCPKSAKGGSGRIIDYPGAYDLVFQPIWYSIYKIARKIL